jgi:hypothetical protein
MRSQLHELELIYPPVSNQEAEWVKNDIEVLAELKKSNLYFIGQKPETFYFFEDDVSEKVQVEKRIYFGYKSGKKSVNGYIDLDILAKHSKNTEPINLDIELGPKLIRIWNLNDNEVLDWFTTDKILHDKSRNVPYLFGMEDYRKFYSYNLHYVGISKKDDSFTRLVVKPHDKRLRILSNEHPLNSGSRLTDEIVLFFFRINSLELKVFSESKDFEELGKTELDDKIRIVADAEKAFIKIMDSKYNEVKFENYPFSTDGLYSSSVQRHTFSIDENITFITDNNTIRGAKKDLVGLKQSDFISISKKHVELIKLDDHYFT